METLEIANLELDRCDDVVDLYLTGNYYYESSMCYSPELTRLYNKVKEDKLNLL